MFEYRKIDLNLLPSRQSDLDALNTAGAGGWELISISPVNIALLKRSMGPPPHEDDHDGDKELSADPAAIRNEMDAIARSRGFTIEDVLDGAQVTKRTVAVKYRDPNNPENTWTGRGRMPRWMTAAIEGAGAKKDDFLV